MAFKQTTAIAPHLITALLAWAMENQETRAIFVVNTELVDCPAITEVHPYETIRLDLLEETITHFVCNDLGVSYEVRRDGQAVTVRFPLRAIIMMELPISETEAYGFFLGDLVRIGGPQLSEIDTLTDEEEDQLANEEYQERNVVEFKAPGKPHLTVVK